MSRPPSDRWVQGNSAGPHVAPVDKLLIHDTEGDSIEGAIGSYRTHNSWPHMTVECRYGRRYERVGHLDLDVAARALKNLPGGVQTNTDGVIQIEVVGFVNKINTDVDWAWFGANVVGPICRTMGIPLVSTVAWVPYPQSYGSKAAQRLSFAEWSAYRGVLGHQHCPENEHGDPGAIPIGTVLSAAGAQPAPIPPGGDIVDYALVKASSQPSVYLTNGEDRLWINDETAVPKVVSAYRAAGFDVQTAANNGAIVWPDWLVATLTPRRPGVDDKALPQA